MSNLPDWQQRSSDFFDDLPAPSNAARLRWSNEKLKELRPEFFGLSGLLYSLFVLLGKQFNDKQFVKECIDGGDSRAAVVLCVSPLLVAAYSDELDAVAMLQFPDHFVQKYGLSPGSRLLTVNNYGTDSGAADLIHGPKDTRNWDNIIPTIAEFASDDLAQIENLKRQIPESEWQRTIAMARRHMQVMPGVYRDGRPFFAGMPRAGAMEYERNLQQAQKSRMMLAGGGAATFALFLMCGGVGSIALAVGGGNNNHRPVAAAPNVEHAIPPPQFHAPERRFGAPPPPFQAPPRFREPSTRPAAPPVPAVPPAPLQQQPAVNDSTPIKPGDRLFAEWGGKSEPVDVLEVLPSGVVRIRWVNWGAQWDEVVPRSRLKGAPTATASVAGAESSERPASSAAKNGAAGELAPGEKVEAEWAGKWAPGTVVRVTDLGWVTVHLQSGLEPTLPPGKVRRMQSASVDEASEAPTAPMPSASAPIRLWTDASGKLQIEARFVEVRDGRVSLRKADGSNVNLPLAKLSAEDQQLIRTLSAESNNGSQ